MRLPQGSYYQATNQQWAYEIFRYQNRVHTKRCYPIGQYIKLPCIWLDGQR